MLNKPTPPMTDFQLYQKELNGRLMDLDAEETQHIKNLYGTPELITIGKIVGPEVTQALAKGINAIAGQKEQAPAEPSVKRRGLATR